MPQLIDHGGSTAETGCPLTKTADLLAELSAQLERWQAELAQAQAQVRSLTDRGGPHCLEQHGPEQHSQEQHSQEQHGPATAPAVLPCDEAVRLVLDALADGARRISHVRSSDSPFLDRLKAQEAAWPDPRLSVQELISRPTRGQRAAPGQSRRSVRTTWVELHEILIIDDAVALIPSPGAVEVTVVTQPVVVRQLAQFFRAAWTRTAQSQESVAPPDGAADGAADGTEIELKHRIVQLLAEGAKDEAVARRLGISLRTCRRHIAEILDQLGASSRFQAGVRAAVLGTVPALGGP
ncbi:helix-turn-helix transcriptional regulator [Kitasatospora sp. NBC_01287]|uniref:helix-turn-helix domain-containing protein n=1 Tax=Kitasatospora sp. NBC_01287 TaxID=2903573 RepID=UPI00224F92B6|nr:helix-turn-helix transcriptional regulator [Kitasatospora sp. NBC_01287]MCX4743968.1 helix-turn-helix transcriptional regulator [Kitasatospora sp. NBC_01287]